MEPLCRNLKLENFTVFEDVSLDFLPNGINVFIGENGTGKTHAMKVLYSCLLAHCSKDFRAWGVFHTLARVMPIRSYEELQRPGKASWRVSIDYGDSGCEGSWDTPNNAGLVLGYLAKVRRPVFISAVDMIGHVSGFGDIYDTTDLDFDYTFREIVRLLEVKSHDASRELLPLVERLESSSLHGKIRYDEKERRFHLVTKDRSIPMPLVAEGLRKISALSRLIANGSLKPGTVLFWDEPEVNLNPKLMDELVDALLFLSRNGVQIFLTTHSFLILEELRDAAQPGEVRYFGFEKLDYQTGVTVKATEDLSKLSPNPILDQYEDLSNRKLVKSLGVTQEELLEARRKARANQESEE